MNAIPSIIAEHVGETEQRAKVLALEAQMREMPQAEGLVTSHFFADGMYARVLFRPAGTLIVGKVHRREHFYIVARGRVQVGQKVLEAGAVIVSAPGTKRAVYALEDSICMTVHRTDLTDIEAIEGELIEDDPQALFDARNDVRRLPCPG